MNRKPKSGTDSSASDRQVSSVGRDGTPQKNPTFQNSAARCAEKVINLDDALARLGGDRQLFQDMAAFFRDDTPALIHNIESGIQDHDAPAVTLAAHTLKNMAATCGGEQTAKIAGQIETCARGDDLEGASHSFAKLNPAVDALNEALASMDAVH